MDIDKTLNDAAADKIRDYRADDSNHHSICLPLPAPLAAFTVSL
jgi:hypothetical protein